KEETIFVQASPKAASGVAEEMSEIKRLLIEYQCALEDAKEEKKESKQEWRQSIISTLADQNISH
ncbi:unnamed protein product, partial [Aphanomyces euteiches]